MHILYTAMWTKLNPVLSDTLPCSTPALIFSVFYLNQPWHKALDNRLNMSGCSLSVTHRSMTEEDALCGIGSHHQGHRFKFNSCLDSCCTVAVVNRDASELCYTWGELKTLHIMAISASMSCPPPPAQITWEKSFFFFFFFFCPKSLIIHFSRLQPHSLPQWHFPSLPSWILRRSPYMSWEETFWVFNLSLRHDALQSHKETTSDHLIVMNSIHIRPLGCWCISKACLGPAVVSSLLPKPRYAGLR